MDEVRISRDVLASIVEHARREAPRECCGVLIGRADELLDAKPTANLSDDPNRFLIDPQGHLEALRDARARELDVVGFYHSHPHSGAQASPTDVAEVSYPGCIYLIVGLAHEPPDVRTFRAGAGALREIPISRGR